MTLFRLFFTASIFFALSTTAIAQDSVPEDEELVEELPNKKLERRGKRIKGPITSIGAGAMLFASFDTNTDYSVNEIEFAAGTTRAFNAADKNNSKSLSLFELEDWREAALGSLDAAPGNLAFDKDYDQRVTQAEFEHALNYVFKAGDKNEDGILAFSELVNVFEMPRRPIIDDTKSSLDRLQERRREQEQQQRRRRGY